MQLRPSTTLAQLQARVLSSGGVREGRIDGSRRPFAKVVHSRMTEEAVNFEMSAFQGSRTLYLVCRTRKASVLHWLNAGVPDSETIVMRLALSIDLMLTEADFEVYLGHSTFQSRSYSCDA
jgi:hypothetical protein